jgi:IS1 transposase/alpha/beta hydrolase fold
MSHQSTVIRVRTATLEIACEVSGPERGVPIILLHGFPDDPRTWDRVVVHLSRAGYRTIAPFLRGYGPTRFLDEGTLRSGQQAALGHDLLALMDGLGIQPAVLVGYDWGAYKRNLISTVHRPGKRNTQQIERKHLTLRTRIKRLVRKTICFSKSTQMHDIVIGLFINRYEFGLPV